MSSVVPENINTTSLGEVLQTIEGGGTPSRNNSLFWGDEIPWATVKDLKDVRLTETQESITRIGLNGSSSRIIPKGTVIIATRMAVGKAVTFDRDVSINQDLKALFPKDCLDSEYLLQWFLHNKDLIAALGTGSTVKGVRLEVLKGLPFLSPPLPEQKKIASILTSVDEVIENTQKQIDKLQDLKKATMNELLTKGIGHTEFKDSELGRIPRSWEVVKFDEITKSITCGVAATPDYVESEEGVPFLSAQNVQKGSVVLKTFKHISPEFHLQLTKNTKPESGDILYSRVGAGYGEAAVVNFNWEFSVYVSLTLIKLKPSCNNHFYQYFLNSRLGKDQAKAGVFAGGGVPNLNVGVVKEFVVLVPPIDEQNQIALTILSIDKSISFQRNKLHQTQSLKKSLMQDLLTGKVRVSVH